MRSQSENENENCCWSKVLNKLWRALKHYQLFLLVPAKQFQTHLVIFLVVARKPHTQTHEMDFTFFLLSETERFRLQARKSSILNLLKSLVRLCLDLISHSCHINSFIGWVLSTTLPDMKPLPEQLQISRMKKATLIWREGKRNLYLNIM